MKGGVSLPHLLCVPSPAAELHPHVAPKELHVNRPAHTRSTQDGKRLGTCMYTRSHLLSIPGESAY